MNKLDRCFLELMLDGEEAYNGYRRVIESANVIMATYADDQLGDTQVYPEKGTVCFSAGLHGWAFTLTSFAKIYAKKFGVEVSFGCCNHSEHSAVCILQGSCSWQGLCHLLPTCLGCKQLQLIRGWLHFLRVQVFISSGSCAEKHLAV